MLLALARAAWGWGAERGGRGRTSAVHGNLELVTSLGLVALVVPFPSLLSTWSYNCICVSCSFPCAGLHYYYYLNTDTKKIGHLENIGDTIFA